MNFSSKIGAPLAKLLRSGRKLQRANLFAPASERLQRALLAHDLKGERWIALGQVGIAGFILILHLLAQTSNGWQSINLWVIGALTALMASSTFRLFLVNDGEVNERYLDLLTFVDVAIVLFLIGSYQLAYGHPSAGSLKAPTFAILPVLIALRALRFHPRPILIAGTMAIAGWSILVLLALALDGISAVTHNYPEYLTSYKILIGAEIEKLVAMTALTAFLAAASIQARRLIGDAAHSKDYAEALRAAEHNMKNAMIANQKAEEALVDLKCGEDKLRIQNERFNALLENMSQGVCMFNKEKRLVACNRRYLDMYDLPLELSEYGTSFRKILEYRIKNGIFSGSNPEAYIQERLAVAEEQKQSTKIQKLSNGKTVAIVHVPMAGGGWLATHEDISELRQVQEEFFHLAHHDTLTGLPNRLMFTNELAQALARVRNSETVAILLIDLDHFKNINDSLGHPIGDKLLKAVTERLQKQVGKTEVIARMGGDEFAIIQVSKEQPTGAEVLAERIMESIPKPYIIDGHQVIIGASIGIAVGPADGETIDTLMRNADLALYRAKKIGRGTHSFFEPEMDAIMQARRALECDIRNAIETGEFDLHYQPLINLESQKLCGFEALLRWCRPGKGFISPDEFIPLAEETGFIAPIGDWVIREACKTAATWPQHLRVAVNLSPIQFRNNGLVQSVIGALGTSGLAPNRLELEITESTLLEDSRTTLEILRQLKQLGVRIVMDDFGTGYSSLSYLQSFPFDKIKIDRSFIRDLADGGGALNIVRAVAAMAKGMGITTTAEGVETEDQLQLVRGEGCTEMQGFLVSAPLPASEIEEMFISKEREAAGDEGNEEDKGAEEQEKPQKKKTRIAAA